MSQLVTFHGCDHKVGTTMISQSVAEYIAADRKELRVLWIVCGRGGGDEYAQLIGESIEGLKGYLDNGLLKKEEVLEACKKSENLSMLGGVQSLLEERYYFPQTMKYLLDCLEDAFDLIIADCGNDIDNGLAMGALTRGGLNILMVKQSEVTLRRMDALKGIYSQLGIIFPHVIINFFSEHCEPFVEEIQSRLQIKASQFHSLCETEHGSRAEYENRTLTSYGNRKFQRELRQLAEWMLQESGLGVERKKGYKWKNFI